MTTPFSNQNQPQKYKKKSKQKWVVLPFLWKGFRGICFSIGLMVLISAVISIYTFSKIEAPQAPKIPSTGVLYLEFKDEIRETPRQASFTEPFIENQPTVREYISAIDAAAVDPRVVGIAARMYDGEFGLTHIQEIRSALARFKSTGKWTKIYSTSYGEGGGGIGRFYLASIFGERWMQPMGIVSITGVQAEVPFVRGVLDKIGIEPQFIQKKEYKNAYESVTKNRISEENRETLIDIVGAIKDVILRDIPADLGMTREQFEALVDQGIFSADQALANGLITSSNYIDVMSKQIKSDLLGDPESEEDIFIPVQQYMNGLAREREGHPMAKKEVRPQVALVFATGAIMSTNGEDYAKDGVAAAEVIAPAIMAAADDDAIKAIVLRVDSPGGSPSASESILRAVEIAQQKGKPVIVSMGSMAASGGYWISAYADRIFALPTTLTGSIGVLGGKIATQELWNKLGVNWDRSVSWGQNAGMWSFTTPFSETERAQMDAMLENVYVNFVKRVAKGRKMEYDAAEKLAHGRVWTGAQALERGLVDEMGGLREALAYAAVQAGAADASGADVVIMPKPKTFQEQIIDFLSRSGTVYAGLQMQGNIAGMVAPHLQDISVMSAEPVMTYEPLKIQ